MNLGPAVTPLGDAQDSHLPNDKLLLKQVIPMFM